MTGTFTFDGTTYQIENFEKGHKVTVTEGEVTVVLYNVYDRDIFGAFTKHGLSNAVAMIRAGVDAWIANRIAFCFELADRKIAMAA